MNFKNIIGHSKNLDILRKMIAAGRVPHALLFSGPEGIGKRLVGVIIAAALNCESPVSDGPCGMCASCRRLRSGTHPLIKFVGSPRNEQLLEVDFSDGFKVTINSIELSGDSATRRTEKINIQQIRGVIKEASLKPYGSGNKLFIIDDIVLSSTEAVNCLLKVLEEPPQKTYFILITSSKAQLFPTIISRCQNLEFNPLSDEEMEILVRMKMGSGPEAEKARELINVSSGSPGRLLDFMKVEDSVPSRMEPEDFFSGLNGWFTGSSECLEKLRIFLEMEGSGFRGAPSCEKYDRVMIIEDAMEAIRKNVNPELAVSNMFLKLGFMKTGGRQ